MARSIVINHGKLVYGVCLLSNLGLPSLLSVCFAIPFDVSYHHDQCGLLTVCFFEFARWSNKIRRIMLAIGPLHFGKNARAHLAAQQERTKTTVKLLLTAWILQCLVSLSPA